MANSKDEMREKIKKSFILFRWLCAGNCAYVNVNTHYTYEIFFWKLKKKKDKSCVIRELVSYSDQPRSSSTSVNDSCRNKYRIIMMWFDRTTSTPSPEINSSKRNTTPIKFHIFEINQVYILSLYISIILIFHIIYNF